MTLDDDRWLRGFNAAILRESTLIPERSECSSSPWYPFERRNFRPPSVAEDFLP